MNGKEENQTNVSDETWDSFAKEYENGTWKGIGEITPGRPKLYDKDMKTESVRPSPLVFL